MRIVDPLRAEHPISPLLLGGKGSSLVSMLHAGFRVPPFIVISPQIYHEWLAASGRSLDEYHALADAEVADFAEALGRVPIPEPALTEVLTHTRVALERWGSLAVRSSANVEDSSYLSFAGIFRTFLGMRDEAAVLASVSQCFASIFSTSCRRYLAGRGVSSVSNLEMSVIIQAMVSADRAGIMLTADAVNQNHSLAIVNASYGLGDTVVQGEVTPDTYVVRKATQAVIHRTLGAKDKATRPSQIGSGTETYRPPPEFSERFALDANELAALVKLGMRLEAHFSFYQDVEWAISSDQIHLLQSRPLTNTRLIYRKDPDDGSR